LQINALTLSIKADTCSLQGFASGAGAIMELERSTLLMCSGEQMPMRQLAKSTLSLGWALSLLSAKQAYGLMTGGKQNNEDALGRVAQAAVGQMDESMKRIHRSTSTVESRMVDMAFSFMNPTRWLDPKTWSVWNPMANCGRAAETVGRSGGVDAQASSSGSEVFEDATGSPASDDGANSRGPQPGDPS